MQMSPDSIGELPANGMALLCLCPSLDHVMFGCRISFDVSTLCGAEFYALRLWWPFRWASVSTGPWRPAQHARRIELALRLGDLQLQSIAKRTEGARHRVDLRCVMNIQDACHLLRFDPHQAGKIEWPRLHSQHDVEKFHLGCDGKRKLNQALVLLERAGLTNFSAVLKVKIHGCDQCVHGHGLRLFRRVALGDGFGHVAKRDYEPTFRLWLEQSWKFQDEYLC